MQRTVVFTVATKNYLSLVRCLMQSVERFHPEAKRVLILADQPEGRFAAEAESFDVIASDVLRIPRSREFHFKYTLLELCTAVKPYAAQMLFDDYGAERLIYLDPDIVLYSALDNVIEALKTQSVVLTPHLLEPIEDASRPSELDILRSGVYNLGFLALARSRTTRRFLDWWGRRLHDYCVIAPTQGIFVDQKWLDLAPTVFSDVEVLRDPGLNVAYWNLHQREISRTNAGYQVNDQPLRFFHFSGFDPLRPENVSKYQERFSLDDLGAARTLFLEYRDRLLQNGYEESRQWRSAYARFSNGTPIHDALRRKQAIAVDPRREETDPFDDIGYRRYLSYWNSRVFDWSGRPLQLTRAGYQVYLNSEQLQQAMPDPLGRDEQRLIEWLLHSPEVKLHSDLREALLRESRGTKGPIVLPPVCRSILLHDGPDLQDPSRDDLIAWFNESMPLGPEQRPATRLLAALYDDRADVRRLFPLKEQQGYVELLRWFLTSAKLEYALSDDLLQPARVLWQSEVSRIPAGTARWRSRAALHASAAFRVGRTLAATIRGGKGANYGPHFLSRRIARRTAPPSDKPFGLNVIGSLSTPSGIGELARATIRAAQSAGIPLHLEEIPSDPLARMKAQGLTYRFNLFHCNADIAPRVAAAFEPHSLDRHYNIGYWAWETQNFPKKWTGSFDLFDEIWTLSRFCAEAISTGAVQPVLRMPPCIAAEPPAQPLPRARFDLPQDQFLFLCAFDTMSVPERKNPFGALKAFQKAFAGRRDTGLLIKVHNADQNPDLMQGLRREAEGWPVSFVVESLASDVVRSLFAACDCFVSLHRAEGLGLMLAESMALNKPVIATGYSGNLDFTTHFTAFLVNYDLRTVGPGFPPYEEDDLWAEPSIEDAVRQMRLVRDDSALRERIAEAGRAYIQEHYSAEAAGKLMIERLRRLSDRDAARGQG